MATSFPVPLRATSEQSKTHNDSSKPTKPVQPTTVTRGRKPIKAPPRKKQPQRGMGVAQLEILRTQEESKLNKTLPAQSNNLDSLNLQPAYSYLPDPIQSFPVPCGSVSYGIPISNGGGGFWSFDQGGLVFKRVENGGFGHHGPGQFLLNHHVFGAPDTRALVGCTGSSLFETSKELSSMPNVMQHLENTPSDVCSKKTRFNGESIGYQDGRREKFTQKSAMNCSGYLGLNLENKTDLNHNHDIQMGGFSSKAARSAFCANRDFTESVEVVAIHRKVNPTMGRNVLMEYEFFPGKRSGKSGTCFNEMELPAEDDSVAEVGNGGGVRNSYYTASNATSNSVDLSLKLSF